MKTLRVRVVVSIAILATVQVACKQEPRYGPPDHILKVGNGQTAAVGSAVATDPAIQVLDLEGRGVPGISVVFTVTSGGGSVEAASPVTDASGTAMVGAWKLGTVTGTNTMTAAATGVPGSPVSFTATATAGPTTSLAKVGSDPAAAPAGSNIDSIVVRAIDQFGNPVPNQTIAFTVTSGGGSVSPSSRVTLADGRAAARWTLGPNIDTPNGVTAARPDGSLPVVFSTTSTRAITSVRIVERVIVVDSTGSATPTITAHDNNGTAVQGAGISLTTRNTFVASAGGTSVTGIRPGQTFLVAASTDSPTAQDSSLVIVASLDSPAIWLSMPRFELKADTTFTVPLLIASNSTTTLVGAATMHVTWDPAVLSLTSQQAGTTNALVDVNTAGVSSGVLIIGLASANGITGPEEIRKLTWKATTTVGRTGSIAITIDDISAASTLANLVQKAVGGSYPVRIR